MVQLPDPINHTVEAIYRTYEAAPRYERTYLGMSEMGGECDRQLWYRWRWASPPEAFPGRVLRLFETGHSQEVRLLDDLRAIGVEIQETDPATGRQWEVEAVDGHFRGHLDGIGTGVPEAPQAEHVIECKTHNDKSFKELVARGVEQSKPAHYAQMQLYMHHKGLRRALYIAVNKNDDALYTERVHYDATAALRLVARAERVIHADYAPPRLHEDPTAKAAFACAWCPARALCHEGGFARVNCRTCMRASFEPGAVVRCTLTGQTLSYDDQQRGCPKHRYLPDLVPAEQTDVAGDVVIYKLPDGRWWHDANYRDLMAEASHA